VKENEYKQIITWIFRYWLGSWEWALPQGLRFDSLWCGG